MESLASVSEGEIEDDGYLQQLEQFSRHRLNLNLADAAGLMELSLLTELQADQFLSYRWMLGPLISIYELQAIPGWDIETIRRILPFVTVENELTAKDDLAGRIRGAEHSFLLRTGHLYEKQESEEAASFAGNGLKLFVRYRGTYKNLLQFGFAGEKDPGEKLLRSGGGVGLDFNSFHFFARRLGRIEALAIGDFTVNIGQGLTQWQGMAFGKSGDVAAIKRQSPVLKPYNSAGEFNFYRGAGVTLAKGPYSTTCFISSRLLSGNIETDTLQQSGFVTSLLTSGYHRTPAELEKWNTVRHFTTGIVVTRRGRSLHTGIHGIYHRFSLPIKKRDEPYNLYAIAGNQWGNAGIDFSFTLRNMHLYGEAAMDMEGNMALINGMMISVDPRADLALLYRDVSPKYQAVNASAFMESSGVSNERGWYAGIVLRPVSGLRMDMYADVYRFPWLKYQLDAPAGGRDLMLQIVYMPNRQTEICSRYRYECKEGNGDLSDGVMRSQVINRKQSWRTQVNWDISRSFTARYRVELSSYGSGAGGEQAGYLFYLDMIHKPPLKPWSLVCRLQYFEAGGYDARIYAFENDVLYSYSIPSFTGKGYRYYITVNYKWSKKLACWWRWAQTIDGFGTGPNASGAKTEIKWQIRYTF